jgi:hypothetical protein
VDRYTAARNSLPPMEEMAQRVRRILASLESEPEEVAVLA